MKKLLSKVSILDKYIFSKYVSTFFFTVLLFTMISVVIDFSEKVEDFLHEACTAHQIIFDYYVNFIPHINWLLWPLISLIAVIFFTSRLAHNSEIISVFNAGISFKRLQISYMAAAALITCIHLFGNHYMIPLANKKRLNFEHTYIHKNNDKGKTENVHLFVDHGTKVYLRFFNKSDKTARDFRLEKFINSDLVYVLKAKSAEWTPKTKNWKLSNIEERSFNGLKETIHIDRSGTKDLKINLSPQDFVQYINQKEMLTSGELLEFIAQEDERGSGIAKPFEIEFHRRTSDSASILILTLIGVAVAARKVRGGMGLHLAIGIGLGALYVFLSRFSITFAQNDSLPSIVGVWIPNLIFLVVSVYLNLKAQK
jgi:lipopolysaccharide export system permease protein